MRAIVHPGRCDRFPGVPLHAAPIAYPHSRNAATKTLDVERMITNQRAWMPLSQKDGMYGISAECLMQEIFGISAAPTLVGRQREEGSSGNCAST